MRRGFAAALLLLPVVEIALAVAVGSVVGAGPTLLALLALSLLGVVVLRSAGRRGWQEMREAARTGVAPERSEGRGLTVFAGLLLAVPGFLTAAVGLLLLLPPVRGLVRRRTRRWVERQGAWMVTTPYGRPAPRTDTSADGVVVEGEVVRED